MSILDAYRDYRDSLKYGGDDYTLLSKDDREQAVKSFQMTFQSSFGGDTWGQQDWFFRSQGTNINFNQELGDLRDQTLIQAAVTWASGGVSGARPYIAKIGNDNKETEIPDHPLPVLLANPNPYCPGSALLSGCVQDWIIYATAYILKARSNARIVKELWYEPYWTIRPRWDVNGKDFISYYELYRNGVWGGSQNTRLDPDDVLVIRRGFDPESRRGQNHGTSSLLQEFYTDQRAALCMALILRGGLVPPGVLSLGGKDTPPPPKGTAQEIEKALTRKMSGDSAGKTLVISGQSEFHKLGFDYSSFGFKEVRQIPEERFCGVMGISPHSLNLGAGFGSSTYANVEQYLKRDYRAYILPLHTYIGDELKRNLLGDFGETDGLDVKWDYSQVPEMQPDVLAQAKRAALLFTTTMIDRAEAREAVGYKMRPEDEGVYYVGKQIGGLNPDSADTSIKSHRFDHVDGEDLNAGRDWWRRSAPKEARGLIDAVKPNGHAVS